MIIVTNEQKLSRRKRGKNHGGKHVEEYRHTDRWNRAHRDERRRRRAELDRLRHQLRSAGAGLCTRTRLLWPAASARRLLPAASLCRAAACLLRAGARLLRPAASSPPASLAP